MFCTVNIGFKILSIQDIIGKHRRFVQRDRDGSEYALPGGLVKVGETLEGGLIRETMEEMGVSIKYNRLLWSEEAFGNGMENKLTI